MSPGPLGPGDTSRAEGALGLSSHYMHVQVHSHIQSMHFGFVFIQICKHTVMVTNMHVHIFIYMSEQIHIHENTHKNTLQNSFYAYTCICTQTLHNTTQNTNTNIVEGGMLDRAHDPASHIHPHP